MADDRHSRYSDSGDFGYRWVSHRTDIMKNNSDNRDELAAMAMVGIVSGIGRVVISSTDCTMTANSAYRIADAMIACKKGWPKPEVK